ncbi:ABC transporter ATP-binding protein [Roseomonas sp. AR75]|uniref:ABC transporter ATP-binding protein n=1 Tax=Roseomonas sp. AR75 TaxID=2562311 RepID=UPI0010BFC205|nr:ABC transporter ATP-binding protein [Roseomonas sp. AR75]
MNEAAELDLQGLVRRYGSTVAVARMDLAVAKGELVALLGPSGCGKTTTLRMVAGFVDPSEGRILLRGRDITRVPAHKRDMGMVFQSYALFPHLSVADNIAFGLHRRGVAKAEVAQRVARMVALLKLDGLEARLPRQLSGGQQQRVAVGRALVINPAVVLLDEPFSNLDALLREGTRIELRRLQTELGLTTLFVTHDQAEAMAISDRIAVMNQGRLEQLGTPREVYERPATRFVAGFIGRANLFEAKPGAGGGLVSEDGIPLDAAGGAATYVLRPERVTLVAEPADGANAVSGTVEVLSFLGNGVQAVLRLPGGRALLVEGAAALADRFRPGAAATARWTPADLTAIPQV